MNPGYFFFRENPTWGRQLRQMGGRLHLGGFIPCCYGRTNAKDPFFERESLFGDERRRAEV
jgi:hypothetical protein